MITRRQKLRQATIDEIKTIAWDMLKQNKPVTINHITREMGMTAPAFYSYFKNRDALMADLVIDALNSFQKALVDKADTGSDIPGQIKDIFMGYRRWAITNPNAFGLFAGRSVSGFDPGLHEVSSLAAQGYGIFFKLFNQAYTNKLISIPDSKSFPNTYWDQLNQIKRKLGIDTLPGVIHQVIQIIGLVHGLISLELSGRFIYLVKEGDVLFETQLISALSLMGLKI